MSAFFLFLDFDGVVHPAPCSSAQHFMHVSHVEAILREFGDLQVVISSSWRLSNSIELMRAEFAPDIAHRIVGVTPELPMRGVMPREREILQWLDQHAAPEDQPRWLAVDDKPEWFAPSCANLYVTDPAVGLDANAAEGLRWKVLRMGSQTEPTWPEDGAVTS